MPHRWVVSAPVLFLLLLSGFVRSAAADPMVVTFDDLWGDGEHIPAGYGGIDWLGGWAHSGFDQPPYNARSRPQRIYALGPLTSPGTAGERVFEFLRPNRLFGGAWFAGQGTAPGTGDGAAFVQFNLYDDSELVHSSTRLTPSDSPAFLGAFYSGPVDRVGVLSNSGRYWVMDDVTYGGGAAPVPEPATLLLLGSGLVAVLRKRARHRRV